MKSGTAAAGFRIWGADKMVYGPVELPALVDWVQQRRVTAHTWIFSEQEDCWRRAAEVPELRMFFGYKPAVAPLKAGANVSDHTALIAARPGSLRRVKALADFTDEQLARFVEFMEVMRVRQWADVVRQGEPGEAMYLVLEGELRVRTMIAGKETLLLTLGPGDFFGEVSLFDQGPRSADVVSNQTSLLLKISLRAFQRLIEEAPDLAARFLHSLCKALACRIRADNVRYRNAVSFLRDPPWQETQPTV